ncbi:MAG: type II secretion system protein [Candidatus Auribacterota bacterium]|nr:type II secretion system protein [Candidatus Auribacterota bacterium]
MKTQRQRGFTLLEVVLVIVIMGILSVISFEFFTGSVRVYTVARANTTLYQMGRNALRRILREARSAAGCSLSGSELVLSNIQPTPLDDATTLRYVLDGEVLLRIREGVSSPTKNPIADQVRVAAFKPKTGFLRVYLEFTDQEGGGVEFLSGVTLQNQSGRFQGDWEELAEPEKLFK